MFRFLFGFVVGWLACNWYVANDRSFDRAFGPLARGAGEALGEASRLARGVEADGAEAGGRSTPSAARRTRRSGGA
jgi:hypothetical protein